ncbi:MAG: DUF4160 domain-containing protein [Pseudomonadota bacterium]
MLKDNKQVKIWLQPLSLAKNADFATHEVNAILSECERHADVFLEAWHDYFGH